MRTGREEKPIPSASNPSTGVGRFWTGGGTPRVREALRKCSGRPPRAGELLMTRIVETNGLGLWSAIHGAAPPKTAAPSSRPLGCAASRGDVQAMVKTVLYAEKLYDND